MVIAMRALRPATTATTGTTMPVSAIAGPPNVAMVIPRLALKPAMMATAAIRTPA
tara:strand:+ start:613 stop:777 length:165 start_codon:yes stop_codon:yes gene_type:complete